MKSWAERRHAFRHHRRIGGSSVRIAGDREGIRVVTDDCAVGIVYWSIANLHLPVLHPEVEAYGLSPLELQVLGWIGKLLTEGESDVPQVLAGQGLNDLLAIHPGLMNSNVATPAPSDRLQTSAIAR
jgi:hypothetical protein